MLTVRIPAKFQETIDSLLRPYVAQIVFSRFFESAPRVYRIATSYPADRCTSPCSVVLNPRHYFDSGDLEYDRTLVL